MVYYLFPAVKITLDEVTGGVGDISLEKMERYRPYWETWVEAVPGDVVLRAETASCSFFRRVEGRQ